LGPGGAECNAGSKIVVFGDCGVNADVVCLRPMIPEEVIETPPTSAMEQARRTKNPLRKLYYWTLHWAATPHALPALFALSFIESSIFPVPPDVLLMAMCFAAPKRWVRYAFWCSVASVLGGLLGYAIGYGLYESVGQRIVAFYHGEAVIEKIQGWYDQHGFLGIIVAAITPIPYKVFTIASGMLRYDLFQFTVASLIGRSFRFFLVAFVIRKFGVQVKPFLEKHFELFGDGVDRGCRAGVCGFEVLEVVCLKT
jgi:membrane protein YqaA with SNARE-associated domain